MKNPDPGFQADFPELKIELGYMNDEDHILLEQHDAEDGVVVHRLHVKFMAEELGLIPKSDLLADRTIAMLTRRLRLLRDRANFLADSLATAADSKHADMTAYARASADIAAEFCADLEDVSPDAPAPSADHAGLVGAG